jgi:hypothetical protein
MHVGAALGIVERSLAWGGRKPAEVDDRLRRLGLKKGLQGLLETSGGLLWRGAKRPPAED